MLADASLIAAIKIRLPINTDLQIVLRSNAAIGLWKGPTGIVVPYRIDAAIYKTPVTRKAFARRVFKDGADRISPDVFLATLEHDAPAREVFLGSVARRYSRTFASLAEFLDAFDFVMPRDVPARP